jgi:very-short-patch-repair endonuclease
MRGARAKRTDRARTLRLNSTDAELKLWYRLRARSLGGFKFVRQEPVGPFVVDFICREQSLIVEIDGGQHATDGRDAGRDRRLTEHGYKVLRFWNNDVLGNTNGVLEVILGTLNAGSPPHPARFARRPLPASGER